MRRALLPAAAFLALVATGCDDMGAEPSMLDEPRFLAVRATPGALTPGGPLTLEALAWEVDGVTWTGCATAFAPTDPPSCPTGALPIGEGNPLTLTAPEGVDPLWVRAEATAAADVLPIVRAVRSGAPTDNPVISAIEGADGPLPASLAPGATLALRARLDVTEPDAHIVSYYTSAGSFEPFRLYGEGVTTLTAPAAPGEATVIAVVRDPDGGTDWLSTTLTVGAP
ncbi:MAG: hypothetical protein EP329_23065 [Deltaproteobacteria bacterium]|nr:MAG: hypothetical protein EP329_23065 [Deltaproteobacteria bacterium]